MRTPRASAILLSVAPIVLALGCGEPPAGSGEGRGVLLICVDALRADHLESAGYDRETTPVLDALAQQGVAFDQTFSTAPALLPAQASLLTGCDPYVSRRILPADLAPSALMTWHIPDEAPRLAQEFLRHGYATAAFVDEPSIAPVHGFAAGFQTFMSCEMTGATKASDLGIEGAGYRLEQWLRGRPRGQNWFAFLHLHDLDRMWHLSEPMWDTYFEPRESLSRVPPVGDADHVFFAIPRRRWSGGLRSLGEYEAQYDGAIRHLDLRLGKMLTRLKQGGILQRTTVAVVGSYGVSFGENGLILDTGTLDDVDLHVPFIVRPAQGVPFKAGLRTNALASLLDVGPTLLALEGLDVPVAMQGVSLAPVLRGEPTGARTIALARCGFQDGYAVFDARYCYENTTPWIAQDPSLVASWYGTDAPPNQEPRQLLHDRRANPALGHLASDAAPPEVVARLRAAGEQWIEQVEATRRELQAIELPRLPAHAADPAGAPAPPAAKPGS